MEEVQNCTKIHFLPDCLFFETRFSNCIILYFFSFIKLLLSIRVNELNYAILYCYFSNVNLEKVIIKWDNYCILYIPNLLQLLTLENKYC